MAERRRGRSTPEEVEKRILASRGTLGEDENKGQRDAVGDKVNSVSQSQVDAETVDKVAVALMTAGAARVMHTTVE